MNPTYLHTQIYLKTIKSHLILPRDGNTACSKFVVEVIVSLVQIDSLDCGELLNVQHILTVHGPRLEEGDRRREEKTRVKLG